MNKNVQSIWFSVIFFIMTTLVGMLLLWNIYKGPLYIKLFVAVIYFLVIFFLVKSINKFINSLK